jgi:hypothetical protein
MKTNYQLGSTIVLVLLAVATSQPVQSVPADAIRYAQLAPNAPPDPVQPAPVVPPATRPPTATPAIVDPAKEIPPEIVPEKSALDRCGPLTAPAERDKCFQQFPPAIKGR